MAAALSGNSWPGSVQRYYDDDDDGGDDEDDDDDDRVVSNCGGSTVGQLMAWKCPEVQL